jgi:pentatricopeptide repeat protein
LGLDAPFFNFFISAHAKFGDIKIMEGMVQLMKDKKCKPGKVIYTSIIQAYVTYGMDEASKLLETDVERFD